MLVLVLERRVLMCCVVFRVVILGEVCVMLLGLVLACEYGSRDEDKMQGEVGKLR